MYVALPVKIQITPAEAAPLAATVSAASNAKGFVMAWSMPYRVGANQSITSFVSNGAVNPALFTTTCNPTPASTYFDSGPAKGKSARLATPSIKPSMLLASYTSKSGSVVIDPLQTASDASLMNQYLAGVRATIALGIAADDRWYAGTAYYLNTSDATRSVRSNDMMTAATSLQPYLNSQYLQQDILGGKADILIYETGLASLDPGENKTNVFLPGAMADTLTSFSGAMYDSNGQISILDFLKAGASASYGTVREPCNYTQKFPKSSVLASHLLAGDSLMEAYSKSVEWPTEGLFIGEPLARPYSRIRASEVAGEVMLENVGGMNGYYNITYNDATVATSIYLKQNATSKTNIGALKFTGNLVIKAILQ